MRRWTALSSFSSCRSAVSVNSIAQAKVRSHLIELVGSFFACPHALQNTLGLVHIFQVFDVLKNRLARIERLGAACALGQLSRRFSMASGSRMASIGTSQYKYSTAEARGTPNCEP